MDIYVFFIFLIINLFFLFFSYYVDSFVLKYFTTGLFLILGIYVLASPLTTVTGQNITASGSNYTVLDISTALSSNVNTFYGLISLMLGFAILALTLINLVREKNVEQ